MHYLLEAINWMDRELKNYFLVFVFIFTSALFPYPTSAENEVTHQDPMPTQGPGKAAPEVELPDIMLDKPVTYSYVENGNEQQKLDYYKFMSTKPGIHPVLIWFHGGGWVKGSREWIDPIAFEIASEGGYDLISADYRLAGDKNAPWPVIVHDVKAVIRWVKFNAKKLKINPRQIIVGGESAGAHLAAMVAVSPGVMDLEGRDNPGVSSNVAAAVLFYGAYNLQTMAQKKQNSIRKGRCPKPDYSSPVLLLLDCPDVDPSTYNIKGCDKEKVKQANPINYVDSSDPPIFIAHGKDDCVVPWTQAREFTQALEKAGVPFEFASSESGEHRVWTLDVTAKDIVGFLDMHLSK